MRKARVDDQVTRQRLLDVATKLFIADGYKDTTIRDISRGARANVAARSVER